MHNNDYGSSMFEYESSLMDIGLTNVQNVDCPEIAIPSYVLCEKNFLKFLRFRKKDVIDYSLTMPCGSCLGAESSTDLEQWKRIQEDHEKMELREKQRFRVSVPSRNKRS